MFIIGGKLQFASVVSLRAVSLTARQRHMTKDDRLLVGERFLRGQRLNRVI